MNPEEYEKMYAQENSYWWFQGRQKILFRMLEKYNLLENSDSCVLDIGCGTGLILDEISTRSKAIGFDFSRKALSFCKKRGLENLLCGNVKHLPIADSSLDLVLALDIMEHIDDDTAMMKEIHRVLKPGGNILITVPAHKYLWSDHDEALHHFRRYSKNGFRKIIKENGFTIKKYSYVISFTFFPILIFRMIQKLIHRIIPSKAPKTHIIILPKRINSLLIGILDFEGILLEHINLPVGVSLLCVAEKKSHS
jgi:ubiquinone/menaquinone biosynthesis C-methylase UbiE